MMKKSLATLVLLVTAPFICVPAASASSFSGSTPPAVQDSAFKISDERASKINRGLRTQVSMQEMIAKSPAPALAAKRHQMQKATAFVDFLYAIDPTGSYVDYFAASMSPSEINRMARISQGKHYELTYDKATGQGMMRLAEGEGAPVIAPEFLSEVASGPQTRAGAIFNWRCPQAAAAFIAWSVGFGLLCFPAGPWGSVACTTAAGLIFTPDFNFACR